MTASIPHMLLADPGGQAGESQDLEWRSSALQPLSLHPCHHEGGGVMEKASRWSSRAKGKGLRSSPNPPPPGPQPLLSACPTPPLQLGTLDKPLVLRGSLGSPGLTSRAQERREGGCQEGRRLHPYLDHRKGAALPQHTRSCSARGRKSAECRASSMPQGGAHAPGQLGGPCAALPTLGHTVPTLRRPDGVGS